MAHQPQQSERGSFLHNFFGVDSATRCYASLIGEKVLVLLFPMLFFLLPLLLLLPLLPLLILPSSSASSFSSFSFSFRCNVRSV